MRIKNTCDEIKEVMIPYLSGDYKNDPAAEDGIKTKLDNHLNTCVGCQSEYNGLNKIYHESDRIEQQAEAEMKTIDWEKNALDLTRLAYSGGNTRTIRSPFILSRWQFAGPVLAAVLLFGVWLGYVLFHESPDHAPSKNPAPKSKVTFITQMETTLTKKEMGRYFKDTQLLLTHLMRECNPDITAQSLESIDRQRVKLLLSKNRYFNQNSTDPEFLSARHLLKKVEFILYEILTLDGENWCSQLQRVQKYIKKENLMLKLRLVSRDVSFNEV